MSSLQVHITAGPQAGARLQLNQSPVSFGRSSENTLVLDLPVVSRQHGELVINEDGQWVLINHSQNGTRVGRKKVTKKPMPLTDGVAITIGDSEVFRVHFAAQAPEEGDYNSYEQPDDSAETDEQAPGAGLKGRSKLWVGIGVWFAICIAAMIFFATRDSGKDGNTNPRAVLWNPSQSVEELPPGPEAAQVAVKTLLLEPLPAEDPNDSRYTSHIESARLEAGRGKRAVYDAYRHYQQATSYSRDRENPFTNPKDRIDYDNVVEQLSTIIAEQYMQAYRLFHKGDYKESRDLLDLLRQEFYHSPEPDDRLAEHLKRLRNAAHQMAGR